METIKQLIELFDQYWATIRKVFISFVVILIVAINTMSGLARINEKDEDKKEEIVSTPAPPKIPGTTTVPPTTYRLPEPIVVPPAPIPSIGGCLRRDGIRVCS